MTSMLVASGAWLVLSVVVVSAAGGGEAGQVARGFGVALGGVAGATAALTLGGLGRRPQWWLLQQLAGVGYLVVAVSWLATGIGRPAGPYWWWRGLWLLSLAAVVASLALLSTPAARRWYDA